MSDPTLFDTAPKPSARTGDPDTSHQAAAAVTGRERLYETILVALRSNEPHGMTDDDIAAWIEAHAPLAYTSPSGLRSRRAELVVMGRVHDVGERIVKGSGRKAIVWHAVPHGQDA